MFCFCCCCFCHNTYSRLARGLVSSSRLTVAVVQLQTRAAVSSFFFLMWVPGIELRSSALRSKNIYQLSRLPGPEPHSEKSHFPESQGKTQVGCQTVGPHGSIAESLGLVRVRASCQFSSLCSTGLPLLPGSVPVRDCRPCCAGFRGLVSSHSSSHV